MGEFVPTFLGSVMKAIACTPNKNFDDAAYEKGVIEPAKTIRKLWEELGEKRPTDDQMRQVMSLLLTIFETKEVDIDERNDRLKEIVERNKVQEIFPDLIPLRR